MTLTPEDIQAIKEALKPEFERIDKRFETVEANLTQKIAQLKNDTVDALGDLVENLGYDTDIEALTKRVENLEQPQKPS